MSLDLNKLKSTLDYNSETGDFTCLINRSSNSRKGDVAGNLEKNGYIRIVISGDKYYAHRLAYFYYYKVWPDFIDHINGDRSDNRISNIRNVDKPENARNKRISSRNTSGVQGVCWYKKSKKWVAKITHQGKSINIGYYLDKVDAIKARKDAEAKYGFHINHGTTQPE